MELAETDSFYQLTNLKRLEVRAACSHAGFENNFADAVFQNLEIFHEFKFCAKNRIELASFIKGGKAYYVAAYKVSDVVFSDTVPLTWERIYQDFKNNPGKRDELVFYEIIPEKDLPVMLDVVEKNIAVSYGKIFSLMFMGKEVPAVEQKLYDEAKKKVRMLTSQTGIRKLIRAANILPYDEQICALLAEKFKEKQMPRCAAAMKQALMQSSKLVVLPEKAPMAPAAEVEPQTPAEKTTPKVPAAEVTAQTPAEKTTPKAPAAEAAPQPPAEPASKVPSEEADSSKKDGGSASATSIQPSSAPDGLLIKCSNGSSVK